MKIRKFELHVRFDIFAIFALNKNSQEESVQCAGKKKHGGDVNCES